MILSSFFSHEPFTGFYATSPTLYLLEMESDSQLAGRFRRLALLVKLILRAFFKPGTLKMREILPAESPAKSSGGHSTMSWQQISQPGLLHSITHRIQQRLQRQATPNAVATPGRVETPIRQPIQLDANIQGILTDSPWARTQLQLQSVLDTLSTYESFMDYPRDIQTALCKVSYYQRLEEGRIVFYEGRPPASFYLILTGMVQMMKKTRDGVEEVVQTLKAGEAFGADEIISNEQRSASCIVKNNAELLVISKSDYIDLSLRQSSFRYQRVKHYSFCKTIPILKHWPIEELEGHPGLCSVQFFKPNAVVSKDSQKSDWIHVIMSGTCRVVKKITDFVDYSRNIEPSVYPPKTEISRASKGKRVLFPDLVDSKAGLPESKLTHPTQAVTSSPSNGDTEPSHTSSKTMQLRHSRTVPNLQRTEGSKITLPVRKPFLIQLQILYPKDVFGLSSIVHERESSITLVSNGAEVIMISRKFIRKHLTESLKVKVQRQVMEYPSEEVMMKRLKDHHTWNSIKQSSTLS